MDSKTDYWLRIAHTEIKAANVMLKAKMYLWVGFHCHLMVEKALKAAIAEFTNEVPPKIHKLFRLAEKAGIYNDLSVAQLDLLDRLTPLHIDGRYAEYKDAIRKTLTPEYCKTLIKESEAFLCWIKNKLGR